MRLQPFLFLLIIAIASGCNSSSSKQRKEDKQQQTVTQQVSYKLRSPSSGQHVSYGDQLAISYVVEGGAEQPDSMVVCVGKTKLGSSVEQSCSLALNDEQKVGSQAVVVSLYKNGAEISQLNTTIRILPTMPKLYTYEVVKAYPHDVEAYTQGLFIYANELYEGTGQKGQSSLRKVDLKTGNVVKSISLPAQYFGEGIAELNGSIYQLTWVSRKGFVYDLKTFEKTGEFSYPTEGWGITTDGTQLIMTDGSSTVYFLDPQTFKELSRIEVYTHKGPLDNLNELEYINGELWANVYMQDIIVVIEPTTGAVTKIIDLHGLLPSSQRTPNTDVLNGIAYNHQTKQLYVTGKNWPKLYEIRIKEK